MRNPPGILACFGIFISLLVIQIIIGSCLAIAHIDLVPLNPFVLIASNGLIVTIMMHRMGLNFKGLFHPSNHSVASTVGLMLPGIMLVTLGKLGWLAEVLNVVDSLFERDASAMVFFDDLFQGGGLTIITLCLVAPFLEEILFRGIMLRGMLNRYSPLAAIVLSAAFFAAIHLNWHQIPTAFVGGLFYGWIYYISQSLWPSILAHAIYNGSVFWIWMNADVHRVAETNGIVANTITFMLTIIGIWLIGRFFNVKWTMLKR